MSLDRCIAIFLNFLNRHVSEKPYLHALNAASSRCDNMRVTDLVSIQIKVLFKEQESKILCLAQNITIMQGEKVD